MIVLVSGGTGRVGRHIVAELSALGHQVIIGSRQPAKVSSAPARRLLLNPAHDAAPAFDGVDAFVHAALLHVPGRYRGGEGDDPAGFVGANLDGSIALFEAAKRAGVSRAVFLSSRAVYDGIEARELHETMTESHRPASLYGRVKLDCENALSSLSGRGFTGCSLRVTGVYDALSPGKWDELITNYLDGRPIAARAGTEVHGHDVAAAVGLILEAQESDLETGFNVSDILAETNDILAIAQALSGLPPRSGLLADRNAVAVMATDRIEALGWKPGGWPLFDETVRTLVSAHLRQR